MEIIIHIESRKIDKDYQLAMEEYIKRTSPFCRIIIKQTKNIAKVIPKNSSKVYRLFPGPNSPDSEGLSKLIESNNLQGISCIEFLIENESSDSTDARVFHFQFEDFNLSTFSMSPNLTAVVLTEQLYRAYTIMNNITYHK